MNEIKTIGWSYEEKEVRTILIDGVVWWIAKDVCEVLEIKDVSQAVERLNVKYKLMRTIYLSGQNREIWLINESGLYRLILRSNKKNAEEFQDWIVEEVLPSIRRNGFYKKDKDKLYTNSQIFREIEKAQHKNLMISVDKSGENERMHNHAYSTYNNMIYKLILGKTASQIRQEKELKDNEPIKDFISELQLKQIQHCEILVEEMLKMEMQYKEIQDKLSLIITKRII